LIDNSSSSLILPLHSAFVSALLLLVPHFAVKRQHLPCTSSLFCFLSTPLLFPPPAFPLFFYWDYLDSTHKATKESPQGVGQAASSSSNLLLYNNRWDHHAKKNHGTALREKKHPGCSGHLAQFLDGRALPKIPSNLCPTVGSCCAGCVPCELFYSLPMREASPKKEQYSC
jgi:hypothetical protein